MSLENSSPEAELAALAQQLADSPETRKEFLRLTKKIKPDLPIPELEIEESTHKALSKANETIEKMEQRLKQKDAMEELEKRRQALLRKNLIDSEEEIKDVEKLMLERGITNHETAAEYHRWMRQAAEPTPSPYNPGVMKKWDLQAYMKNPVTAARDAAAEALKDLRKPTRPIGL